MRDVKLVTLSEDGSHLILSHEGTGEQFALAVDDRVRAAVVSDRARLGQLQLEIESRLRPREIQARVRAGESTELIAEAAGVPLERVLRYAGPVLAEREHVIDQAQRCAVRRHGSEGPGEVLDEAVHARLRERGADRDAVSWDAWRVESGKWAISVHYTVADRQHRAVFSFDPGGRLVVPSDEPARWLAGEQSALERWYDDRPSRRAAGRGDALESSTAGPSSTEQSDQGDLPSDAGALQTAGESSEATGRQQRVRLAAVPSFVEDAATSTPTSHESVEDAGEATSDGTEHDHSEDTLDLTELLRGETAEHSASGEPTPAGEPATANDAPVAEADGQTSTVEGSEARVGVPPHRPGSARATPAATRSATEQAVGPAPVSPHPASGSSVPAASSGSPGQQQAGRAGETSHLEDAADATGAKDAQAANDAEEPVRHTNESANGTAATTRETPPPAPRNNRQRSQRSRSKRAVVPSWDEILFGASGNSGSTE